MRVLVDEEKCVGCGLCEETLPGIFTMGRFTAKVTVEDVPDAMINDVITLIEDCPAEALAAAHSKKT